MRMIVEAANLANFTAEEARYVTIKTLSLLNSNVFYYYIFWDECLLYVVLVLVVAEPWLGMLVS